jgi:hypothetical protein
MVVDLLGMLNHVSVKILFDSGATNSFISPCALEKCGLVSYEHDDFKQVKMASGEKQVVGPSIDNFLVELGVCITRLKLYVIALGAYDVMMQPPSSLGVLRPHGLGSFNLLSRINSLGSFLSPINLYRPPFLLRHKSCGTHKPFL